MNMASLVSLIKSAVVYGTVIMFGAMGESITERSGHLNLGVPGEMFLGGIASFVTAYLCEQAGLSNFWLLVLPLLAGFAAAALGGLLYSFFTVVLRVNQNVTGLALTSLGVGIGTFFGAYLCRVAGQGTYMTAARTSELYRANLANVLDLGVFSELFLSYGFLVYFAVILAIGLHHVFFQTRTGLNLRAVGENPATADAAGVNVTAYKFWATTLGGGICGLGGVCYVLVYAIGGWTTQNNIEGLGWLAVALVIFANWKPLNTIWGSYLFAFLFWLYAYLPGLLGIRFNSSATDLLQAIPYVVTIIVLVAGSVKKNREKQPPAAMGLPYFREDR